VFLLLADLLDHRDDEVEASEENGRHTNNSQQTQKMLYATDRLAVSLLNLIIDVAEHGASFS
jgi:hypothetical protein